MSEVKEVVVHFSGGTDSTLAAALYLNRGYHVHLLTYDRSGFIGSSSYTNESYERLKSVYGETRIARKIVNIEALHKFICYKNYLSLVRKFGLASTSLCFSKLAMHLFSCAYAKRSGVSVVADGAVSYMKMYPDQNKVISVDQLRTFYSKFEISYENPVFEIGDEAEQMVYDLGITPYRHTRGTDTDKQVYYVEQVFLAFFLKYYDFTKSFERYEADMKRLYQNRIGLMQQEVSRFLEGSGSLVLDKVQGIA